MVKSYREFKSKFFDLIPLILLFVISFNGFSIVNYNFFSISIHYILIYYWVLKQPQVLGNGFIFLAGLVTDVIFGLPMGLTPLTLLIVAGLASYVRLITVRASLLYDWIAFIPTLLVANFIYYIALYFSELPIDYFYLFKNSLFTFIFYPFGWILFSMLINFMGRFSNA